LSSFVTETVGVTVVPTASAAAVKVAVSVVPVAPVQVYPVMVAPVDVAATVHVTTSLLKASAVVLSAVQVPVIAAPFTCKGEQVAAIHPQPEMPFRTGSSVSRGHCRNACARHRFCLRASNVQRNDAANWAAIPDVPAGVRREKVHFVDPPLEIVAGTGAQVPVSVEEPEEMTEDEEGDKTGTGKHATGTGCDCRRERDNTGRTCITTMLLLLGITVEKRIESLRKKKTR
jgi:hypothetical protein